MTNTTDYTMLLMGTRHGETDQAAALLAREGFVFQRVPVANYVEPRLEYKVGTLPKAEVTGIAEIRDVIAVAKEELARLNAA